jgi:hypothetical protein
MRIDRWVPSFAAEAEQYLLRQRVHPMDFILQLEDLMHSGNFTILDDSIVGLRAARLAAPLGGEESLLAVDHKHGRRRIVVFVSIQNYSIDRLAWQSKSAACKQRINIAVAKLIGACRNGSISSGLCGAVG